MCKLAVKSMRNGKDSLAVKVGLQYADVSRICVQSYMKLMSTSIWT